MMDHVRLSMPAHTALPATPLAPAWLTHTLLPAFAWIWQSFLIARYVDAMTTQVWDVPNGWDDELEVWQRVLVAQNKTDRTIETRIRRMRTFARAFNVPPYEVTEEMVFSYAGSRSWAAETRHSAYVTLRAFFSWFAKRHNTVDPAHDLPSVRRVIPPPRPAPETVYRQALDDADSPRTVLILRLAGNLGLRADEISRVHVDDIQPDLLGYSLRVHGKGNTIRLLPLLPTMHRDLVEHADPDTGWVFPGLIDGHLSARWVSHIGSDALPGEWTLHTLRHRFATESYRHDRDLLTVQRLLGHADVSTTQRYVEPPHDAVRNTVSAIAC